MAGLVARRPFPFASMSAVTVRTLLLEATERGVGVLGVLAAADPHLSGRVPECAYEFKQGCRPRPEFLMKHSAL